MHVYKGNGFTGVTIVNYGVSLNVSDNKATVEYNGVTGDFYETLRARQIGVDGTAAQLTEEQLAWLEDNQNWVKLQIENSR